MSFVEGAANVRCESCDFESPLGFRFCGRCGHPLADPAVRDPSAEYRQVTVVFCDLVDSVTVAERLDPEDLREVLRAYQSASAAVVERYAGHVAQYLGDGLLIYFGYPRAQGDDARRAVYAAAGIVAAVEQLNADLEAKHALRIAVRVGIHTGLVIAGEVGGGSRREHLALGVTPNVAARLQALAPPGGVLLSRPTAHLIEGFFDCESLGPHQLKGIAQSLEVYRLIGESGAQGSFEVALNRGLVPMVGRQSELELMLDRFEQAAAGRGQVVQLIGEAGIGKSRLVYELEQKLSDRPVLWRVCRGSPYHSTSALYPVIELGHRVFQGAVDNSPQAMCRRLERRLAALGFAVEETLPLVADLLSLPLPEGYQLPELGVERKKQLTFEVLIGMLFRQAEDQPAVVCIEDLHWMDPSSLELIELMAARAVAARVLVLLTMRPGFAPPWAPLPHQTTLGFDRLSDTEAVEMITHVAAGAALPQQVIDQLLRRADGVPLFVEELARAVVESELGVDADIPATLRDSLMARLDRLGPAKGTAQLAAVFGRELSYTMLSAISTLPESELQAQLAQLVASQLCYQRGGGSRVSYLFKHALLRDAAYESLLKSQRVRLHQRIAEAIEEHFPALAETEPEFLARHLMLAGLAERAADAWLRAGQRAYERGAYPEALDHLGQGLAALERLPPSPARCGSEVALWSLRGVVFMATHGHASPEVEHAFARALALCDELGESETPFELLYGVWGFCLVRGEIARASELATRLLRHHQTKDDFAARFEARYAVGMIHYFRGEVTQARDVLEAALELEAKVQGDRHRRIKSGEDPAVMTLCVLGNVLWLQGFPEQALVSSRRAFEVARSIRHAFSECFALLGATWVRMARRDTEELVSTSERLIALACEKGFGLVERVARIHLAIAAVLEFGATASPAEPEAGRVWCERIAQVLDGARTTGLRVNVPFWLAQVANAFIRRGLHEAAEPLLEEAFAAQVQTGERVWEAELHRLRGELERERDPTAAEIAFGETLAVARRQGALSFELRAAMGLAMLLADQGRIDEARGALEPVYARFTEGFDTADLRAARELLAGLGVRV